ncbi:hypothetical protein HELRODRAFT_92666 [Helobdella robusta]|uniref:Homeobox domain-containing protein n=1 Tax=Helobdella robusta TaxID=6412 RepID=T1G8J5_HELRO|nr:hypothetical protein HELRODRAFT_92666 [Helobdella robusta]XP_009031923.1 hypothetical protein HELRODRAFT_91189 [Helobdella robusta]ESN89947.1 hypothetical protein HELRODRAFT_91189 [Helobdella robusta]ESN99900.1 hypothetical protein HELRODRAFT_92666 [Helobdella robusta]
MIRTDEFYREGYSVEILNVLEREFSQNQYINRIDRERIVNETSLTSRQVKYWFQNRRVSEKKLMRRRLSK